MLPWDVTKRILTFFSVVKFALVTRAARPRGQVLGKSLDLRIGQSVCRSYFVSLRIFVRA